MDTDAARPNNRALGRRPSPRRVRKQLLASDSRDGLNQPASVGRPKVERTFLAAPSQYEVPGNPSVPGKLSPSPTSPRHGIAQDVGCINGTKPAGCSSPNRLDTHFAESTGTEASPPPPSSPKKRGSWRSRRRKPPSPPSENPTASDGPLPATGPVPPQNRGIRSRFRDSIRLTKKRHSNGYLARRPGQSTLPGTAVRRHKAVIRGKHAAPTVTQRRVSADLILNPEAVPARASQPSSGAQVKAPPESAQSLPLKRHSSVDVCADDAAMLEWFFEASKHNQSEEDAARDEAAELATTLAENLAACEAEVLMTEVDQTLHKITQRPVLAQLTDNPLYEAARKHPGAVSTEEKHPTVPFTVEYHPAPGYVSSPGSTDGALPLEDEGTTEVFELALSDSSGSCDGSGAELDEETAYPEYDLSKATSLADLTVTEHEWVHLEEEWSSGEEDLGEEGRWQGTLTRRKFDKADLAREKVRHLLALGRAEFLGGGGGGG